jgi:hypothetical protein
MSLATKLFNQSGEDLQVALESIADLQDRVVIVDNDKLPYDQAIEKLDKDLFDQCLDVNKAFGVVETAYEDRINATPSCRTDLFWRVTQINSSTTPSQYSMVCTKLSGGGYPALTKGGAVGLGSTVAFLHPNGTVTIFPRNATESQWHTSGVGYTFGFEPRNYYGVKYYTEPYSDDIGNTLVGGFIGTITQGQSTLTIMNPVGAGLSEKLEIGQIVNPQNVNVFASVAKITGITTGLTDLRNIESLVGIADTLSFVNILTVDQVALQTLEAPQSDGTYPSFDLLDDPDNFADQGREKYALNKLSEPFLPQTVGIMQTANLGIGISIALDHSGYPSAPMAWDPNLEGYVVEYSANGTALAGPVEAPKVGSGVCYWRAGFQYYPRTAGGDAAEEGDTRTIDSNQLGGAYAAFGSPPTSACSAAIESAITTAIGIATVKETALFYPGTPATLSSLTATGSGYFNGIFGTSGGTGSGLVVSITTNDGAVSTVTISAAGSGYTVGDTITIASGNNNATFTIATLADGFSVDNVSKEEGLNALRAERNEDYSLPIWGMRCGIGAENEIVDRLVILQRHLDNLTIRNVIDS